MLTIACIVSCGKVKKEKPVFTVMEAKTTGLHFTNKLTPTPTFNMLKYMYFYNGAGTATGDFNNDGKIDIFFTSNQGANKIFLNKGELKFEDVTTAAKIPDNGGWSTGVATVDINNDGKLDLYISKVGYFNKTQNKNQFLICTGFNKDSVPQYTDEAQQRGVDFSAFGTQAAFLDYDKDGDLDMYMMNHSLRFNGTMNERSYYDNTTDSLAGDKLLRNDNGKFTDVSKVAGISGTIISYGLGICVSDINVDGYPDIYVGNDFHENDYLYINQKNGTYKETLQQSVKHTSQFSMGVDVADINNDALPEIISMDMLPYQPEILKRSLGEDEYNTFQYKTKIGYMPQFARNALQLNNGNGTFSEIGMYAGVDATDWSWASLLVDFDNDGWKDLFVSNGIPKRLNDMDYVAFVSNAELQNKIRANAIEEKDMALINKFPEVKLKNKFFRNKQECKFEDLDKFIENDKATFSNGASYADFDNDGDVDFVVNNIDDEALVYKNNTNDDTSKSWCKLILKGDSLNLNAEGAKLILFYKNGIQTYEKNAVKGFQSAMENPIHFGLGNDFATQLDSAILVWPNNSCEKITVQKSKEIKLEYKNGLPQFDYTALLKPTSNQLINAKDVTTETGLNVIHEENQFNEFDRELLMPYMVSKEGPALAIGDANGDGLDDMYIGASKFKSSKLFLQNSNGTFKETLQTSLALDSTYEDVDAYWIDVNSDKALDLIVASGGNEYYGKSEYLKPRLYINDGKANLTKVDNAFANDVLLTASCIAANDFNGDGKIDLFIGARAKPFEFGKIPNSYLLLNNGDNTFKNVTAQYNKDLSNIGFVTDAQWCSVASNKSKDLVLSLEWGNPLFFTFTNGTAIKHDITKEIGWWRSITPLDIDSDGDTDFIAGNMSANNRLHPSTNQPVEMFYNDYDDNGKKEQVVTYYLQGKKIPFANKDEVVKQLPILKKRYLYAQDFATHDVQKIFGAKKLNAAEHYAANYFYNAMIINNGNGTFTTTPLPWQAQLSPINCSYATDINGDGKQDVLIGENFFHNNIQMGKYDASNGAVLINMGNNKFEYKKFSTPILQNEVRKIKPITINKQLHFVYAQNNAALRIVKFDK